MRRSAWVRLRHLKEYGWWDATGFFPARDIILHTVRDHGRSEREGVNSTPELNHRQKIRIVLQVNELRCLYL